MSERLAKTKYNLNKSFMFKICMFLIAVSTTSLASEVDVKGKISFENSSIPNFSTISLSNGSKYFQVNPDEAGNYIVKNVPTGNYKLLASGTSLELSGTYFRDLVKITNNAEQLYILNIILDKTN